MHEIFSLILTFRFMIISYRKVFRLFLKVLILIIVGFECFTFAAPFEPFRVYKSGSD